MAPKKIMFITREIVPFYYGGIGTLFKALARLLSDKGHSISFLSQAHDDFDREIFQQQYGETEIHFVDCPHPSNFPESIPEVGNVSSFQFAYNLAVAEKFDSIVSNSPPDIVISADFGAEGLFVMVKARLGNYPDIRFILHISGSLYHLMSVYESGCVPPLLSQLEDPQNRLVWAMEDGCIPLAPEIIVPTQWTWKETLTRINVETNLHVIPNYPDQNFSLPEIKDTHSPEQTKNLLFIGRLDRCKGADLLLKLFIDFHNELPADTKLTFIGRDCACKEYKSTFLQYWSNRIPSSCKDKIEFLGQVEHSKVKKYLGQASLCIFPSRWEVFGLVCLEAMAHGVPIMVSKNTGPAEVIGTDLAEYAFDFECEQEQIIKKIQIIFSDPSGNLQLRKKMRQRAQILIEHAEKAMEQLIALMDALMRTGSAMGDIAFFLGKDILKIQKYFHQKGEEYHSILNTRTNPAIQPPEPPQSTYRKVLIKIKKLVTP